MNEITTKQRILAAVAHAGFYLGGIGFLIVPFLIKTIWNNDSFVAGHAKQAFYMQLGVVLISLIIVAAAFVVPPMIVTMVGIGILVVIWGIFAIIAAVKALSGEEYVYPLLKLIGMN